MNINLLYLYQSKNINDIIDFYKHFDSKKELIRWLTNLRKDEPKLFVLNGEMDEYNVVVPTKTLNRKIIKRLKKQFTHCRIILCVCSSKYFNYAHSVNRGIQMALKHKNCKWIIIASDDLSSLDPINKLNNELKYIDDKKIGLVFPKYVSKHHFVQFMKYRWHTRFLLRLLSKNDVLNFYILRKKFNITYIPTARENLIMDLKRKLLYKPVGRQFLNIGDFAIFSARSLKRKYLFDEIFLNNEEDIDVSTRIDLYRTQNINFTVNCGVGGKSLGNDEIRALRAIATQTYLNEKLRIENRRLK